jgi:hypothetical protein
LAQQSADGAFAFFASAAAAPQPLAVAAVRLSNFSLARALNFTAPAGAGPVAAARVVGGALLLQTQACPSLVLSVAASALPGGGANLTCGASLLAPRPGRRRSPVCRRRRSCPRHVGHRRAHGRWSGRPCRPRGP